MPCQALAAPPLAQGQQGALQLPKRAARPGAGAAGRHRPHRQAGQDFAPTPGEGLERLDEFDALDARPLPRQRLRHAGQPLTDRRRQKLARHRLDRGHVRDPRPRGLGRGTRPSVQMPGVAPRKQRGRAVDRVEAKRCVEEARRAVHPRQALAVLRDPQHRRARGLQQPQPRLQQVEQAERSAHRRAQPIGRPPSALAVKAQAQGDLHALVCPCNRSCGARRQPIAHGRRHRSHSNRPLPGLVGQEAGASTSSPAESLALMTRDPTSRQRPCRADLGNPFGDKGGPPTLARKTAAWQPPS